ncbi:hypothetical protein [Gluconacetobacter azotocaptans]|uniref:hypothetical protein n=1 Tax=Gluconacetobacter azotocaptans TaxID=142834 RepID=UPI00195E1D11|nr:hypothetical protein [Gluconacetobacter azotocaptans]
MKAFARLVYVNVRFYRSPYIKPTFRLPGLNDLSAYRDEQTGGFRLHPGHAEHRDAIHEAVIRKMAWTWHYPLRRARTGRFG